MVKLIAPDDIGSVSYDGIEYTVENGIVDVHDSAVAPLVESYGFSGKTASKPADEQPLPTDTANVDAPAATTTPDAQEAPESTVADEQPAAPNAEKPADEKPAEQAAIKPSKQKKEEGKAA